MTVALFSRADDKWPLQTRTPCWNLVAELKNHQRREDKDGPLFSPTSYLPGTTRGKDGVDQIFAATADVDSGISPEEFLEQYPRDLEVLLYSTFSSTPDHPKFRAITPFATPAPSDDWPIVRQRLQEHVWCGAVDVK